MERFASRSNGMLGCSSFQNSFTTPSTSSSSSSQPKVPFKNPDIDFDDVFGGPPRRSAIQDPQYSSNEIGDLNPTRVKEKPVFGGAGLNHRRYPSNDFFDDIFRGDESSSPTPRKVDRDPFCSAPGSRVLSPARPLPPRAEPFNSSSIPAQFSLPANLAKGVAFPPFGYGNHSEYRGKDSVSNIMGYTSSSSFPMSRFSSQPIHGLEESRNEVGPFSPHSPFSHKLPLSGKELSRLTNKPNKISAESNLNRDSGTSKVSVNSCQFHFSIYKWASKGAPLIRPFGRRRHLRSKEKVETETWSSSNGGKESYCTVSKLSIESHQVEFGKQGNDLCLKENINARTEDVLGSHQIIETFLAVLESERIKTLENSIKDDGEEEESSQSHAKEEAPSQSLPDVSLLVKAGKEAHKPELKSLHSLLYENTYELGDDGITTKAGRIESKIRTKPPVNIESEKAVNMLDKEEIISTLEADKASMQGSSTNYKDNLGRDELKGKVKTFVNIFNQEASSKPKINIGCRSQSSRWRSREMHEAEKQTSFGSRVMDEEKQSSSKNKKLLADAPAVIGGKFKQKGKENSGIKDTVHKPSDSGYEQKNGSASAGSETALNMEESFQEAFLMLSPDQHLQRSRKDHEEIQVSDAKIQKWSSGKEGNIRSLLSTLQFVLWADSGWKPVPLVDIIEANAVKRAYQKALLCLHPDKLQQKAAASHQKYLAGKVFDILREAWIHFNSLAD